MKKRISLAIIVALTLVGCGIQNAYQMTKCEYTYQSISGVKVAGIDFANISGADVLTALPYIKNLISGNFTELPIELTVNLNVKNPDSKQTAAVADIRYAVNIDDVDIVSGNLGKEFKVEPGKTSTLPVVIKTDLCNILNDDNRGKIVQMVKNFTGISKSESTIKLKVKPVLLSNSNAKVTLPEIPISFKYSGRK